MSHGTPRVPLVTAVVVTVPYGVCQYTQTVEDRSVWPSSRIMVGWGPVHATDENDPSMDDIRFSAVAGDGECSITIASDKPIGGAFNLNYLVG